MSETPSWRADWPSWLAPTLGVAIYVTFRTTMALGANLQRYSMRLEEARLYPRERMEQPLLVLGVVLFTLSGVLLSVPLIFAPQTLLSPCGVIIFVANAIFASALNEEVFLWRREGVYLLGVSAGVVTCIITAPKETSGLTTPELVALCAQPLFIAFMLSLVALISVLYAGGRWFLEALATSPQPMGRKSQAARERMQFGLTLCMAGLAGGLGGLNITATKSILSLIEGTWETDGFVAVVLSPLAWLIGLSLLFTYAAQIRSTTDGLERCAAMLFVPVQTVTEETVAMLGGLLYFQEYRQFELVTGTFFTVGIVLSIASVARLTAVRIEQVGGLEVVAAPDTSRSRSGFTGGEFLL